MMSGHRLLFVALVMTVAGAGSGCENIGEPWKKEGVWEQERQRGAETAEELDHRLRYTQVDR